MEQQNQKLASILDAINVNVDKARETTKLGDVRRR